MGVSAALQTDRGPVPKSKKQENLDPETLVSVGPYVILSRS